MAVIEVKDPVKTPAATSPSTCTMKKFHSPVLTGSKQQELMPGQGDSQEAFSVSYLMDSDPKVRREVAIKYLILKSSFLETPSFNIGTRKVEDEVQDQ